MSISVPKGEHSQQTKRRLLVALKTSFQDRGRRLKDVLIRSTLSVEKTSYSRLFKDVLLKTA